MNLYPGNKIVRAFIIFTVILSEYKWIDKCSYKEEWQLQIECDSNDCKLVAN